MDDKITTKHLHWMICCASYFILMYFKPHVPDCFDLYMHNFRAAILPFHSSYWNRQLQSTGPPEPENDEVSSQIAQLVLQWQRGRGPPRTCTQPSSIPPAQTMPAILRETLTSSNVARDQNEIRELIPLGGLCRNFSPGYCVWFMLNKSYVDGLVPMRNN